MPYGTASHSGNPPQARADFIAIDEDNFNPKFMHVLVGSIPSTDELASSSHLPLVPGVQPLAKLRPY